MRCVPAQPIAGRPWCKRRWLVLAPHPDDETLGAGALIAQASRSGLLAGMVYLTDGSGPHPAQDGRSGHLIATRAREAKHALRRLAGIGPVPVFLEWTDAAPAPARAGQACFDKAGRRLAVLCERLRVDVLATTAALEPHCDHEAAAALAYAVRARVKRSVAVAEYVVWGSTPPARTYRAIITAPIVDGVRRRALAAHRSQLTASLGAGFRLPKDKRRMGSRDTLYVRKR